MDTYIGQLLDDRYELLELIGTGGMAVVYKAKCHRLNRLVAVKILKEEFSGDEDFRKRFRAEGEAVAMLSHPNIVQVYDVSSTDSANFIVMELIDGISLKQYMEVKGVLNWKETLHFASQIAKGLEHAHSRGIVHRDIKPHNVMVLKNGSVKVMDFGIAQVMNKASTLTKEALGSVHYISPEQAKGSYTDNRSDLYSLGVVMYEMMAGRPPYDGESPVAVAIQHINGGAPAPSIYNPNIPAGLEQIIMRCMAHEPRDRYANATELLQDLEEFRKNPTITFQYKTVLDAATKTIPAIKPQNTAEKIAKAKGGTTTGTVSPPKANTGSLRLRPPVNGGTAAAKIRKDQPVQPQVPSRDPEAALRARQRRREEERIEAERSRVATIAIIICSFVAVVAIVVFLVAIFNGALINREKELIAVPDLLGDMYSDNFTARYPNFTIRLQPQQYDSMYAKGQIMHQEPEGGTKVEKGTELYITVSMGEEPVVKVMMDLTDVSLEQAQSYLVGQGFKTLVWEEASPTIKVNHVIRTEPEANTELVDGQTIKIYVSTGPEVQLGKMPDVVGLDAERAIQMLDQYGFTNVTPVNVKSDKPVGQVVRQSETKYAEIDVKTPITIEISEGPAIVTATMPDVMGLDKETAIQLLTQGGFKNVTTQPVESNKPKGQVVGQSHKKQTELDVTTKITLDISQGPSDSTIPTNASSESSSLRVTFVLPDRSEAYTLSIFQAGKEIVGGVTIQPGETSFVTELTGSGIVEYDLFINGDFYQIQRVKFGNG